MRPKSNRGGDGTESSRTSHPSFAEPAIHRLRVTSCYEFSQEARGDDDNDEERGHMLQRLACSNEKDEETQNGELMRQIDLVAALAQLQKWREDARSFPQRLCCHGDDHAGSDCENRHIKPITPEAPAIR